MASHSDGNDNNFSLMQHLINEMDASNHRIDLFSKKFDGEVNSVGPTGKLSMEHHFETLYDDAWKSEESDVASLQELPVHFSHNDDGDSGCEEVVNSAIAEVSNDFLSGLRHSSAQNQCPDSDESRISSDNDFKRLTGMASYARYPETATGLSDTDWNPYGTESDNNQSPRLQPQENGSDSKSSLLTSFTPLLNSTDINTVTNAPMKISQLNDERMSDILEQTERENTLNNCLVPNTGLSHTNSTLDSVYTPLAVSAKFDKFDDGRHDNKREKELSSSKDSISSDEEKRMIASTSSTGYSSATSGNKIQGNNTGLSSKSLSVIGRAKLMGIPEDILLNNNSNNPLSKTRQFHPNFLNNQDYESDDQLGKKVRSLLSDTTHLSTYDKVHSSTENSSNVDYTVLQRDLQEIQDNLDSFGVNIQENKSGKTVGKSPTSSDGEDIIPSTTTTPERRKEKMMWDFAGDIGALGNHRGVGMMEEISLDTHTTSSQRPSTEKPLYNSDGDETRTSESSTKQVEDHAAADLALAEMSEILHPSMRDLDTSLDIDHMVSNFQHKRRQLESRYQELNNQGLAEKVYRILTNQNPESQANGILSEISADEKELRTKMVLNSHDKRFNYSSTSSWLEELNQSNQSLNPTGDVRKKLDMSGLSSVDSSWMFDKSASKGFSALDDAKRLLSSQMMKASERTFNHSMEMRVPQSIHCYPLLVGNADENGIEKETQVQQNNGRHKVDDAIDQGTERFGSQQNERDGCNSATHQQEHADELVRSNTSPNSSDQGTTMRPKDKYRPYRPPGSKEVYYTESDTASVADSVTTMESTHIGSDDAKGPNLPSHVMGSRRDPPNVAGIYSAQRNLSTVREDTELATIDEKSENNSESRYSRRETDGSPNAPSMDTKKRETSEHSETHKYTPISRTKREDKPDEINQRKRYDFSVRDDSERTTSMSPTRGIAAARRDARWALRRDELNREGLDEKYESFRAHNRLGINRQGINDDRPTHMDYDTPKSHLHFEGGRVQDNKENEPLSLRIQMTYTDENNLKDGRRDADQTTQSHSEPEQLGNVGKSRFSERDAYRFDRYSPELRNTHSSTYKTSGSLYHRHCPDENMGSLDNRLSPAFRHALSPDGQNSLARAASDENLSSNARDARLSPAFRHALSPELRNAIERRSPLLSRHLERSLAQPPSDYPGGNKPTIDDRYNFRSERPTFLARERPLSPMEYMRHPINDNPSTHFTNGSETRLRPRSVSPTYSERNISRHRAQNERQREGGINMEDVQNRVVVTQGQPNTTFKRKVELTLEGMSSESEADLEMDQKPISKRAQLLKSALANEGEPSTNCDINAMWEKFKAMNDSSISSVNSSRIEAVADLLKSPSRHLVSQYVKDREEYRIERQERAEIERERRLREQQMQKHSSSEDEINERYAELLAIKEEERLKRRASKKKKGKVANSAPDAEKKNEKDSLFSIPEDRSYEPSPTKSNTPSKHQKPKGVGQTHVIDPNMLKLRERIAKQKTKVDKDMMKEMRRIEKLKKLEGLLTAKKKGKITSETLQTQLEEISSTSAVVSDFSHESAKDNPSTLLAYSDDSTTAKDSSAEMHAWKAEKERRKKEVEMQKQTEGRRTGLKERNNPHFTNSLFSQASELTEIRLLKLVKEGYLTAEEAYKLAIDRATHETMDSSRDSSNNSYHGKRHNLYSPYSRSSSQLSQMRHVPKLKFSGTVPYSSYGMEEFEIDPQQLTRKARRQERNPKSHSLTHGTKFSPAKREKSFSPISRRHASPSASRRHASPSASRRHYSASPPRQPSGGSHGQHYSRKAKQHFLQSKKYVSENDLPRNDKGQTPKGSVAWHIPMDLHPSQWKEPLPKQQPLQEVTSSVTNKPRKQKHVEAFHRVATGDRKGGQDFNDIEANIWTKPDHPPGIPKLQWEQVVSSDALASKINHWEVDPLMDRVQYILNKQDGDQSQRSGMSDDRDNYKKPLSKLSLQEAFYSKKHNFISKCSERQKRMKLAKEERHLQECLRLERDAIFAEQERLAPPNLYAHPYSDNLYQPKHRILTKQEMKTLTARRYNKLPEVVEKKEDDKKQIEARLNRLRANLFNKKVQRNVLQKLRC